MLSINTRSMFQTVKLVPCFIPTLLYSATVSSAILDEGAQQVGRYSTLIPAPRYEQSNLLAALVTFNFPNTITHVGEAMTLVLQNSGYRLADKAYLSAEARAMLALPLPAVHRHFELMPLWQVINTLAGLNFVIVNDPVRRLIAFRQCAINDKGETL